MAGSGSSSPAGVVRGALLAFAILGVGGGASCGPNREPVCTGQPAFVLTVRADSGPLPSDLEIEVHYGGSPAPETYRLDAPHEPEVVFCVAAASPGAATNAAAGGEGGGAPGSTDSVACRLWTAGPASVTVRGAGYPPVVVDLLVDEGLCTVIEEVELMRGDAGSGS